MTFELGALTAIVMAIIAGAMGYGRLQSNVGSVSSRVSNCEDWKASHEKEVADKRVNYEREISRLRESINGRDGKFDSINFRLDEMGKKIDTWLATIDKKIDKLENREERERNDRLDR